MQADLDATGAAIHLDGEAAAALLSAAQWHELPPDLVRPMASPLLDDALATMRTPLATLTVTVAGGDSRLRHRIWATPESSALLLGVRDDAFRLMASPPAFLTAALVRLTRMRVRAAAERSAVAFPAERLPDLVAEDAEVRARALADAGADFGWRLEVAWAGGGRVVTAVDGPRGLHLADEADGVLRPVSNTFGYRVLSTVLPTDQELAELA